MSEEAADNQETATVLEKTDAEALLKAANSASERLAGQHLAFMAVCAYVLTIVFGTTDLDLLMGKGVRLPVVNVDVPIIGFYAFAPYIVVLIHFNLLLQLQLLSRKLFAFDAAAPQEEGIGGWRDRLHIFPYTYYLVGRPSPMVRPLMGLMVSITVVLLPLITLLALQLEFLAYQSEAVTWWQRGAIWLDMAAIAILWPIILHPRDDWCGYWRDLIAAHVPRRRVWLAFALLFAGFVLALFGIREIPALAGLGLMLVSALAVMLLRGWQATPRPQKVFAACLAAAAILAVVAEGTILALAEGESLEPQLLFLLGPPLLIPIAVLWQPKAPRGSLALLLTLLLGLLLPLALLVDGERLEELVVRVQPGPASLPSSTVFSKVLQDKRRLYLYEQVLLAKPPKPETLALIRSGQWQKGLEQIEPLNLQGRNLRHAKMGKVILIGADLRHAQLQGAELWGAQLQGVNLYHASLRDANLRNAWLQGADLGFVTLMDADLRQAQLQGADLGRAAWLQGANLWKAQLQGANLDHASLRGANLWEAQLQGANLREAQLEGANLWKAQLQGANLDHAQLQGANLREAQLQGVNLRRARLYSFGIPLNTKLIDAREVVWEPLADDTSRALSNDLQTLIKDKDQCEQVLDRLKKASRPGAPKLRVQSCLAQSDSPLVCEKRYDPQEPQELADFKKQLHAYLAKLACGSTWAAKGLLYQILKGPEGEEQASSRKGLGAVLKTRLDDPKCAGVQGMRPGWKESMRALK